MQFNRSISYTSSWKYTFLIGLLLAIFIIFILIFLQPFDTYLYQTSYKSLRLSGYSVCIFIPILVLHVFEEFKFKKNHKKWFLIDEVVSVSLGFLLICFCCSVYNYEIVNRLNFHFKEFINWMKHFALPFAPIFIPIWLYLRFRFSKITILNRESKSSQCITIKGTNYNETVTFLDSKFVMAQSQANYVDIYVLDDKDELKKHVIRYTLSGLITQIPNASQVHRSFLINTDYILELKGNTRQGSVMLQNMQEAIPVSPKHFKALKVYLQNHP